MMSEPTGRQLMGLDPQEQTQTEPPAIAETTEVNPADTDVTDLGQVAYEAYCAASDGKSLISGEVLPGWDEQAPEIRAAWRAAGRAVQEHSR